MTNSRRKGKEGELELAKILRDKGKDARRGQQYCGANGDADVVGLYGIHIECKRTKALNVYKAVEQAVEDAKDDEMPAVFWRKDNDKGKPKLPWLVTMRLDDFMEIYDAWDERDYNSIEVVD